MRTAFASMFLASALASCPDLLGLRSQFVLDNFDAHKLEGLMYEQSYADVAQVGAKCQTLNTTVLPNGIDFNVDFKVDYGPIPFTIVEQYTNNGTMAYYNKNAKEPGGKLLTIQTVVVDVVESADKSRYDSVSLYSCISVGVSVTEAVIATRTKIMDPTDVKVLEDKFFAQGVPVQTLKRVDQSACKN